MPSSPTRQPVRHLLELGYEDPLDIAHRRQAERLTRATQLSASIAAWRRSYRQRDWAAAAGQALDALSKDFSQPVLHCCLGMSLARMQKLHEAAAAIGTAVQLKPDFDSARRMLLRVRSRIAG